MATAAEALLERLSPAPGEQDKPTAAEELLARVSPKPSKKPRTAAERLQIRFTPMGVKSGFREGPFGKYGVTDYLPYVGTANEIANYVKLFDAAESSERGAATPEQQRMLEDYYDYQQRPTEFGYLFGSIGKEAGAFMGEFGIQGRLLKILGKGALRSAKGQALKKAMKRLAGEASERGAVRQIAVAASKVIGKGAGLAAMGEALGVPFEASRTMASARRLLFQRNFELLEDDAGDLQVMMAETRSDMLDVLPQALLDTLIEMTSEVSGAAIGKVAARIPLADKLFAIQARLAEKLGVEKFMQKVTTIGYHGMLEELGEEAVGDLAREAAAAFGGEKFKEMEGSLTEKTVGDWLEMGAAFGAMGGGFMAGGKLMQQAEKVLENREKLAAQEKKLKADQAGPAPAPDTEAPLSAAEGPAPTPAEGGEVAEAPESAPAETQAETPTEPAAPEKVEEGGVEEAESELDLNLARVARAEGREASEYVRVEPEAQSPKQKLATLRANQQGLEVDVVEGMRSAGVFVEPGRIAISATAKPLEILEHEAVHSLVAGSGGTTDGAWLDLYRTIRKFDAQGLRSARKAHREAWIAANAPDMTEAEARSAYIEANPRGVMREEGFATRAQEVFGYMELLRRPDARRRIRRLLRGDRSMGEKLLDYIRSFINAVSNADLRSSLQRRADEVSAALEELTGEEADFSEVSAQVADLLVAAHEQAGQTSGEVDPRFAPQGREPGKLAAKGEIRPKAKDQLERLEANRQRALEGEDIGRPDLARTSIEDEVAAVQTAVDEERNFLNLPGNMDMKAAQDRGETLAKADPDGMVRTLLGKLKQGEGLSVEETFAVRYLSNGTTLLAIQTSNKSLWKEAYMLQAAYRQTGTNVAREFAARRAAYNRQMSGQETLALLASRPTLRAGKKIERLTRAIEEAEADEAEVLRGQLDALFIAEAEKSVRVGAALRKQGYDPQTITNLDWQNPIAAAEIANIISVARADIRDKAREYLYSSYLSWMQTHARNVRGNAISVLLNLHIQDAVEMAVNTVVKDPSSPQTGELKVMVKALLPAMKEAGRRFFLAYRTKHQMSALNGLQGGSKFAEGIQGPASDFLPNKVLRFISLDLLLAADEAFKGYIGTFKMAQLTYRKAKAEGLSGSELEERVLELMYDPDIRLETEREELYLTFQDKFTEEDGLWKVGESAVLEFREVLDKVPFLGVLLFPFVKTSARLFRMSMRRSPLALANYVVQLANAPIRGGYKGGRRQLVKDTADAIIAGLMAFGVWSLIDDDDEQGMPVIGGSPAKDYAERLLQYRTRRPMTVKIMGVDVNYKQTDPIALSVATTIDTMRALKDAMLNEDKAAAASAAGAFASSVTEGLADATYLRTFGDLVAMMQGRGKGTTEQFTRTFVTPWVPNVIKGTLRSADGVLRQDRTRTYDDVTDAEVVLKKLPYRLLPSKHLAPPPRRDMWGRTLDRQVPRFAAGSTFMTTLMSAFSPLEQNISGGPPLKVDIMLVKYNQKVARGEAERMPMPAPPQTYTGKGEDRINWTDEEYDELVKNAGEGSLQKIQRMRLHWDDPTKRDIERVKKTIKDSRSTEVRRLKQLRIRASRQR